MSVHGRRDVTVHGRRDVAVHGRGDVTVHGRRDVAVHGRRDVTVHGRRDVAPWSSTSSSIVLAITFADLKHNPYRRNDVKRRERVEIGS